GGPWRPPPGSALVSECTLAEHAQRTLLSESRSAGGELTLGCQAVRGRRTSKTPRSDNGVTDGTSQGGGWDESHNGIPIQVVQYVPSSMEDPAETNEAVR